MMYPFARINTFSAVNDPVLQVAANCLQIRAFNTAEALHPSAENNFSLECHFLPHIVDFRSGDPDGRKLNTPPH